MPWWRMQDYQQLFQGSGNELPFFFFPIIVPLIVWSLIWKGLALYRAARNEQKVWYVVMLILNTAGILEILYLLFFSKPRSDQKRK